MTSKTPTKGSANGAAPAPASSKSKGKKHARTSLTPSAASASAAHSHQADSGSDDEDFRPLPKEETQRSSKKRKKNATAAEAATTFNIPPPPTAAAPPLPASASPSASNQKAGKGKQQKQQQPVKLAGTAMTTIPVMGEDDEEMDDDSDVGGMSDSESDGEEPGSSPTKAAASSKDTMTKTEAKAARFYDRPTVSAASILPNTQERTPAVSSGPSAHAAVKGAVSGSDASSGQMLAPLLTAPSSVAAPPSKSTNPNSQRKVIVVLVKASLETVKTKKGYELVSADTHKQILQKLKKNPSEYRPDILHQCLLTLLDSPLNKAGHLQVYVQTEKNVLIEVHPSIRIPRTFKRFAGLMVQLLHKLKIRSSDSSDMLLKVIRNPVTDHLPVGALKIGTSVQGELVDIRELATNVIGERPSAPVVFCVGSHASGPADVNWTDQSIAISKYPLSASVALGRICNAFEGVWNVL